MWGKYLLLDPTPARPIGESRRTDESTFRYVRCTDQMWDVQIPHDIDTHAFWETAFGVAITISEHISITLQGDGDDTIINRLAAAILMILGSEEDPPLPLRSEDHKFLSQGIPESITNSDDPYETLQEYSHRKSFNELMELRGCHSSLQVYGLRSITDPLSEQWCATSREDKLTAIRNIAETIDPDCSLLLSWALALMHLYLYTPINVNRAIICETLLLHAALDPGFTLPIKRSEITELTKRFYRLQNPTRIGEITRQFSKAGIEPLQRSQIDRPVGPEDPLSAETTISTLSAVIQAGIPLLDAITQYCYDYGSNSSRWRLEQLPRDLFILTAHVVTEGVVDTSC
jgi:hypothetical protein